jgi:uncharacterized protein YndB with AHSA1/START domain
VSFTERIDAPPEEVWKALTDPAILADWLMPNDFVAEVGRRFTFEPDHETPWEGNVECEVLELVPARKMSWSWKTSGMKRPSRVQFELVPKQASTEVVFTHQGEADEPVTKGLTGGWPDMLERLTSTLRNGRPCRQKGEPS